MIASEESPMKPRDQVLYVLSAAGVALFVGALWGLRQVDRSGAPGLMHKALKALSGK